jgi:hypothetical protein
MARVSIVRVVLLVLLACTGCAPEPRPDAAEPSSVVGPTASITDDNLPTSGCRSADLELGFTDRVVPPTGQRPLSLTLTNRSVRSCYLFGYPVVIERDDTGRELPFDFKQTGDQVVTADAPTRVDLAPGDTAYVTIDKYRCDLGDRDLVSSIELVAPGDVTPLQVTLAASNIRLGYCGAGDPGSVVYVSPVVGTFAASIDSGGRRARAQATRGVKP